MLPQALPAGSRVLVTEETTSEELAAERALEAAGVHLRVGARVEGFDCRGDRIAAIALAGGERVALAPDAVVVSAMPWHALQKVLGERAPPQLGSLRAAPIVTAYFETSERRPPPLVSK